jgi:hypothetical protein
LQAQIEQQQSADAKEAERLKEDLRRTQEKLAQLERQQVLAEQQARVRPPTSSEPNIVPFELAPQTRGTGKSVNLTIPPGTDYALLQLELGADNYLAYQAELRTQSDEQLVWKSGRLKARDSRGAKIIELSLRASLLAPRSYILKLKGISQTGAPEDLPSYAFRVVGQ